MAIGRASVTSPDYPGGPADGTGTLELGRARVGVSARQRRQPAVRDRGRRRGRGARPRARSGRRSSRTPSSSRTGPTSRSSRVDGSAVRARIFERGVGETLSSGTGASGAAVAAFLGGAPSPITVSLDGGALTVEVSDDLDLTLTGTASRGLRGRARPGSWCERLGALERPRSWPKRTLAGVARPDVRFQRESPQPRRRPRKPRAACGRFGALPDGMLGAGVFLGLGGDHMDERTHLRSPSRGVEKSLPVRPRPRDVASVTAESVRSVTERESPPEPVPTSMSIATIRPRATDEHGDAEDQEDALGDRHGCYLYPTRSRSPARGRTVPAARRRNGPAALASPPWRSRTPPSGSRRSRRTCSPSSSARSPRSARPAIDVISLGIGDPDRPTYPHIVEAMQAAVADPGTHQYPSNRGRAEFREAFARFYDAALRGRDRPRDRGDPGDRRQGVHLQPLLRLPRPRRRRARLRPRLPRLHRRPAARRRRGRAAAAGARARLRARPRRDRRPTTSSARG